MTTLAGTPCAALMHPPADRLRASADPAVNVRLGPIAVVVRGAHRPALADFARLYGDDDRTDTPAEQQIELNIVRLPGLRRRYRIADGGGVIFDDLRAGEVLPYLEWAVNYAFLNHCRRFVLLHAATVCWHGMGMALVGPSGSGKSTLAASLVARGAEYLCDEFALVDPETLRLHPFPRALCVKAGAFALIRALGLPLWRRRSYVKAFKGRVGYVRAGDLRPARRCVPLDVVVFPRFTGAGGPMLHRMARSQAAFALAGAVLNSHLHRGSTAETAARIAARATCRILEVGPPAATADLLARRLVRSPCCLDRPSGVVLRD